MKLLIVILMLAVLYYWNDAYNLRMTNQLMIDAVRAGATEITFDNVIYVRSEAK